MISVIVSSHNLKYYEQFVHNVSKTIGVTFEIIRIENIGEFGICEAYNKGIRMANYPILCFAHEDISFLTQDWGKNFITHFENDNQLGLIGVAGASYKPWVPSGWSFPQESRFTFMNIIQSEKEGIDGVSQVINKSTGILPEVISVDGCLLCTTKAIANEIGFDEKLFRGYHYYDISFSLAVRSHYKVAVVFDVLVNHFSKGSFNSNWLQETFSFQKHYANKLPQYIGKLDRGEIAAQEWGAFKFLWVKCISLKAYIRKALMINFNPKFIRLIGIKLWLVNQIWILYATVKYFPILKSGAKRK